MPQVCGIVANGGFWSKMLTTEMGKNNSFGVEQSCW